MTSAMRPDVTLRRASRGARRRRAEGLRRERLEFDDLLPDAEHVVRAELDGHVANELLVDAVQRASSFTVTRLGVCLKRRVARREVAVAREDAAGLATDRDRGAGKRVRAGFAAVGAERRQHDVACGRSERLPGEASER